MRENRLNRSTRRGGWRGMRLVTAVLLCVLGATGGMGAERQMLRGHVPAAVGRMKAVSRLDAGTRMDLAIALPLRNQKGLTELLRELYDPRSPMFHHYLTPEQFAAQFGPSQADYDAVAKYAGAHGLAVTYRHPNRLLLDVAGRAGDVEKALHVTMRVYRHPTEGRLFYAPDREPSLDLQTPVAHVSGLDNYAPPQPRVLERPATARGTRAVAGNAGTGPNGEYMGKDFRAAYAPGVTLTGSGQAVGLLQFDGYSSSDITYYETAAGLPTVTCTNVLLDHSNGRVQSSNGQTEVSLDIEMTMSMAPGIAKIIVYEAPPTGNYWHDLLNRMATDNLAKQLSCSWYIPGGTEDTVADGIFQEMAAQGQTFFSASGDSDAFTGLIPFPGDTPYITEVGGTTLTENGNGGSYNSETVWNWGNGSGSGGGISTQYGIPSWQQGISMTASKGSTTMRNVPDVAMTADNVYVRAGGADHDVGGTSCAAPLWAGFMALVNQEAALNGRGPVGFLNPAVYGIGTGAKYGTAFHDITNGNNTSTNSPNNFYAVSGYDLCTGWGTPTGSVLINALALGAEGLQLSASPFVTGGPAGGPFNPGSYSYSFVDSGTNALTWTASATQAWLSLSATSGTLAVGGTATVVATINANANGLGNGVYTDTITFTDTGTGFVETEPVTLTVSAPPSITSGLTATATNGVGFNYQIVASNSPTGYGASGLPGGLSVNGATGLISGNTTATGTYNVGLSAANASGTGTATLTLTVLPAAPVITSALTATTTVGMGFDYQITASNGAVSYSASGLPAGLSVDPTAGLISGTATAIGSSNVTIAATNAGGTGSATLALTVNPQAPVITSGLTATGTNGGGFSYQITATNNPGSYSASGLPAGLGINSTSGIISGTATVTGTFNATINATNAGGTGSATLVITMLPPAPVITSALSAAAVYGQGFSYQITASVPATFAASGLPAGLSVDPNSGIISGTTTATGVNDVIISAINSSGTGSATLVLTVSPPGPVITSATTAIGIVGLSFNYQITASNSPTSYGANGLPGGLSVNTSSGVIHGTPSTTGTSYASIIATNGSGRGSATLMIVVKPPGPVITSSTTAFATEGQAFSYQITATNNPTSYAASGLPAGLSIDTVGGVISGTIPVTGTTSINISAVNQTSVGTAVLTVVTRTPYASWKSGVFAAADLSSASISGDTATPAGDGIPNLMKYALNLNPYADGVGGLPVAGIMTTGSGNYLALTYTQVLAATDISYIVEVSGDLQTWNSGSGYTLTPVVTPNGDGVTETVVVPAAGPLTSGTQCQFMRLRVTLP